ncbi:MAG: alanine:cation symporter family protein [Oscillospiraceae bacterium]|nr:alanine:cation symporter family protein [Oscillospiraceae bacterium]
MNSIIDLITHINDNVNTFVWTTVGVWLLIAVGIVMSVLTGFFQVTRIGHWMKKTIGSIFDSNVKGKTGEKASISQFQALCTALAATVGVGNIAGVAAAIMTGGPGTVFWMWLAAFFGMMTNYSENVLGIYFRRKNKEGEWSGGAMYYLRDGLGGYKGMKGVGRVLAVVFSVCAVLAAFGIGNMGQVNKIVVNFTSAFRIDALSDIVLYTDGSGASVNLYMLITGIVIMLLVGVIVIGGIQRIASVAERIVPFMVAAFVLGSLIIIFKNIAHIGPAFSAIFSSAFTGKAVWGGVTGITLKQVITLGCKRGVFSNEAGLGSSVMVHSNSNVVEPVKQGLWGIFEVFADTMIVCTMTALVILTSGVIDLATGEAVSASDSTLVAEAFGTVFRVGDIEFGKMFIALAILLFAFTTVLGWSHYGTKAVEYLAGNKSKTAVKVFKTIFTLMIISGAVLTSSLAWDISDTFNGMMMIPNLIGVLSMAPLVRKITKNYIDRRIKGKTDVRPMLSFFPETEEEGIRKIKETGAD